MALVFVKKYSFLHFCSLSYNIICIKFIINLFSLSIMLSLCAFVDYSLYLHGVVFTSVSVVKSSFFFRTK